MGQPASAFRALVVDDDPIAHKVIAFALHNEGFLCDLAADGVEALQRLATTEYDLVVTDLRMPHKHGHALSIDITDRKFDFTEGTRRGGGDGGLGDGGGSEVHPLWSKGVTEDFHATDRLISGFSAGRGPFPTNPETVYPCPGLSRTPSAGVIEGSEPASSPALVPRQVELLSLGLTMEVLENRKTGQEGQEGQESNSPSFLDTTPTERRGLVPPIIRFAPRRTLKVKSMNSERTPLCVLGELCGSVVNAPPVVRMSAKHCPTPR